MINQNFIILGVLLNFFGSIPYFIETIKGKVKPNKVTWALWSSAPLIAFLAELHEGVGITSLVTFVAGFSPLTIFIASFLNKKSHWQLGKFDFICGGLSLIGLLSWAMTKNPNLAIIFSILADGLAALPTISKSYYAPETENATAYFFSGVSAVIGLLTLKTVTLALAGFPMYLVCTNFLIFGLIIRKYKH